MFTLLFKFCFTSGDVRQLDLIIIYLLFEKLICFMILNKTIRPIHLPKEKTAILCAYECVLTKFIALTIFLFNNILK